MTQIARALRLTLTNRRPIYVLRMGEVGGTIAQLKKSANLGRINVAFGRDDDDPYTH